MDEAISALALTALDDAEAAATVFAELDLAAVTPDMAAQVRDELAEVIRIYRRLHRAIDAAAESRATP